MTSLQTELLGPRAAQGTPVRGTTPSAGSCPRLRGDLASDIDRHRAVWARVSWSCVRSLPERTRSVAGWSAPRSVASWDRPSAWLPCSLQRQGRLFPRRPRGERRSRQGRGLLRASQPRSGRVEGGGRAAGRGRTLLFPTACPHEGPSSASGLRSRPIPRGGACPPPQWARGVPGPARCPPSSEAHLLAPRACSCLLSGDRTVALS